MFLTFKLSFNVDIFGTFWPKIGWKFYQFCGQTVGKWSQHCQLSICGPKHSVCLVSCLFDFTTITVWVLEGFTTIPSLDTINSFQTMLVNVSTFVYLKLDQKVTSTVTWVLKEDLSRCYWQPKARHTLYFYLKLMLGVIKSAPESSIYNNFNIEMV
jgi:hypothetical protein